MIKSLSIVFPIFNEESRLRSSFNHILSFIKQKKKFKIEIIFVDDGSIDRSYFLLTKFVNSYKKSYSKNTVGFKIVKSKKNLGKGSALKLGIKKAKYNWILTADIDMSVSLFEICTWDKKKFINKDGCVYIASRSHKKSIVERDIFRKILGDVGSFLISLILNIDIKDTQCGYKLYKTKYAKFAFSKLVNYGFDHDIEIVLILKSKNIEIKELPVKWQHKNNSKVNIFLDPIKMFIGIFVMRFRYF